MFLVLNFWRLALFTILSRDLKVLHLDYECHSGQYLLGIGLLHQRKNPHVTRMHSSRMRTARSLTVSHGKNHARPPEEPRTPLEQPHMPPREQPHTPPPEQPRTPPPEQPHMPRPLPPEQPRTPPRSNHARPPPPLWTGQTPVKNITFANFVCGR